MQIIDRRWTLLTKPVYPDEKTDCLSEFINDLTVEMDEYLLKGYKESKYFYTYIMQPRDVNFNVLDDEYDGKNKEMHCAIRVHGATRGHIKLDENNNIEEIKLYNDTCFGDIGCYSRVIINIFDKYKGCRLMFE